MIKIDHETIEFNGTGLQVYAEAGLILRTMYQEKMISEKDLNELIRLAKMSDEEISKEVDLKRKTYGKQMEFVEKMMDMLKN